MTLYICFQVSGATRVLQFINAHLFPGLPNFPDVCNIHISISSSSRTPL